MVRERGASAAGLWTLAGRQLGRLGARSRATACGASACSLRRRHLSYTLWVGMENGKTWPMAETILSYLLAELESSNPQRISKKIGGTDIEAKALFLLLVEGILTRLSSLVV